MRMLYVSKIVCPTKVFVDSKWFELRIDDMSPKDQNYYEKNKSVFTFLTNFSCFFMQSFGSVYEYGLTFMSDFKNDSGQAKITILSGIDKIIGTIVWKELFNGEDLQCTIFIPRSEDELYSKRIGKLLKAIAFAIPARIVEEYDVNSPCDIIHRIIKLGTTGP